MPTVVMTGFTVWGRERYNSSWENLKGIELDLPDGWRCETQQLPVSWSGAPAALEPLLTPDVKAVICFGMTGGDEILIERLAGNLIIPTLTVVDDAPHTSEYVCPEGPPAYYTGLPVDAILSSLRADGVPCGASLWAGPHLCNFIFYWLMRHIAERRPDITGGFVHVPPFDENGGLSREVQARAVRIIARRTAEIASEGMNL